MTSVDSMHAVLHHPTALQSQQSAAKCINIACTMSPTRVSATAVEMGQGNYRDISAIPILSSFLF